MKRKLAIVLAALALLVVAGTGLSGCGSSATGDARSSVEDGMYDVSNYLVHKNSKTESESYYFLVTTNEGELKTIRVPKSKVKQVKTRQSSYISARDGSVTFFIHDEELSKPEMPADDAYEKRFAKPPAEEEKPKEEPKQPQAIQPSVSEEERDRIFNEGYDAGYDDGYDDGYYQ
ncbi:MAG: hypothetical protein ACYC1U_05190 [Candidatus Aquicultorales bacterium]